MEKEIKEYNAGLDDLITKNGVVSRGTTWNEVVNMVIGDFKAAAGRKSVYAEGLISTSARLDTALWKMNEAAKLHPDQIAVTIEYDIADLKKGTEWKTMEYRTMPDLLVAKQRLGEKWEDAYQSASLAWCAEAYIRAGAKPAISNISLHPNISGARIKTIMKQAKQLGIDDKIKQGGTKSASHESSAAAKPKRPGMFEPGFCRPSVIKRAKKFGCAPASLEMTLRSSEFTSKYTDEELQAMIDKKFGKAK